MTSGPNSEQSSKSFLVGPWKVDPSLRTISDESTSKSLSPRAMDVLVHLASRPGEVISNDTLLEAHWPKSVRSPNAVQKVVNELRHALGAGHDEQTFIETVPKRGYRLLPPSIHPSQTNGHASVNGERNGFETVHPSATDIDETTATVRSGSRSKWIAIAGLAFFALAAAVAFVSGREQANVVTSAGRTAVMLPIEGDVSSVDRRRSAAVQAKLISAFEASSGVPAHMERRIRLFGRMNAADTWDADYAVHIEIVSSAADAARASVAIVPADPADLEYHEELQVPAGDSSNVIDVIAQHIGEDLAVLLDRDKVAQMREWGTANVDAYRYALEGDAFQHIVTAESLKRAEQQFRLAITADPTFGYGYISLAAVYDSLGQYAADPAAKEQQRKNLEALLAEASTARIAPSDLSLVEDRYRFASVTTAFDAARYWQKKLLENPDNLDANYWYIGLLVGTKLFDEAARYTERALKLPDPYGYGPMLRSTFATLADARGDFEEAIRREKIHLESQQGETFTLFGLVRDLSSVGRFEEAQAYVTRLEAADPAWAFAAKADMLALRGSIPLGSSALEEMLSHPLATNAFRAELCLILGDIDCGVRNARHVETNILWQWWKFMPCNESHWAPGVIEDPRYQAVLEEIGIGHSWRAFMRQQAHELSSVTGIDVTTPPPPEDRSTAHM